MDAPVAAVAEASPAATETTSEAVDSAAVTPESNDGAKADLASEETKAARKKYKVKVDGEEAEVDEDELLKGYQRASSANKRFEEAAQERKRQQEILERVKSDPLEFVKEAFGVDVDAISEARLAKRLREEIENQNLSPEARELRQLKRERAEWEAKQQEAQQQAQQGQLAAEAEKIYNDYHSSATKALESVGLSGSDINLRRVAVYAQQAAGKGLELSWPELAAAVKEDLAGEHTSLFGGLEGESLLNSLGPDLVKKVNAALVAKYRKNGTAPAKPPQTASAPKETGKKLIRSEKEFDAMVAAKFAKFGR